MGREALLLSLFHYEYNVHEKFVAENAANFYLLCTEYFLLVRQDPFKLSQPVCFIPGIPMYLIVYKEPIFLAAKQYHIPFSTYTAFYRAGRC